MPVRVAAGFGRGDGYGDGTRYGDLMPVSPGNAGLVRSRAPSFRQGVAFIRSAPATYGFLVILLTTSLVLARLSDRVADRLLLEQSTNLHHLAHDPLRVLVSSAFWAPGNYDLLISAILFTLVLAPVERRIGSVRTLSVFAIGHVGATLVTGAGLWVALRLDSVASGIVNARDVGTSYGFFAVAAAMTYLLARVLRAPYAVALVAYLATTAALSGTFGDYGHLIAMVLGFASYPIVSHGAGRIATPILAVPSLGRRPAILAPARVGSAE